MQGTPTEVVSIILLATLIFLLAPLFLLFYVMSYNKKKKLHQQEKELITERFESELLKTSIEVQEQTMQTIATDLHDNIGQLLSLTNITLGSIDLSDRTKSATKIAQSLELVEKSIKELRQLAKLIQGEQLLEKGLSYAVQQEVNWLERSGNYSISLNNDLVHTELSSAKKDLFILRMLQECFSNIIRHADAQRIKLSLELNGEYLHITIDDDGKGFDIVNLANTKNGLGLNNLKKRSEMIGGQMVISSNLAQGTCIRITVPYP